MTNITFDILARDGASAVFGKIAGQVDRTDSGFRRLATGAAVLGTAAIGLGALAFKMGEQFDAAYDGIRVGTGATGAKLEGLKNDFREVVKNVPTDFASASTAITDLARRTGLTGEPLRKLATQFLELSRLTGTSLPENIKSLSRVFGDWKIAVGDQGKAMDAMFRTTQQTGIGITQLGDTVVKFGAPLRQLGFDFEESIALLGKWEQEGVNIEVVLAGMKKALANFAKAGKEPAVALQEISDKIKNAGSASEATKIAIAAFGTKAGPDLAAAIREGRFEVGSLFNAIKNGEDTIEQASTDTRDFSEKWQIFKNRVMVGLEPVVTGVFDAIGKGMDDMAPVANFIKEEFGPQLEGLAKIIKDNLTPILIALGATLLVLAGKAVIAWIAFLGPIGLVIAAVGVLAFFITKHWDEISAFLQLKWNQIKTLASGIWQSIKRNIVDPVMEVVGAITAAWNATVAALTAAWNALKTAAIAVWNAITTAVLAPVVAVVVAVMAVWNALKAAATAVWDAIKWAIINPIKSAVDTVTTLFKGLASAISTAAKGIADGVTGAFNFMLGTVQRMSGQVSATIGSLGGVIRGATAGWDNILSGAGSAVVGGLISGIGSKTAKLRQMVQGLAAIIKQNKGPITKDRVMLVPEGRAIMEGLGVGLTKGFMNVQALVGNMASRISTNVSASVGGEAGAVGMLPSLSGTAPSSVVNVHFHGPVGSPDELRAWLARALDDLRRQGRFVGV